LVGTYRSDAGQMSLVEGVPGAKNALAFLRGKPYRLYIRI